MSKLTVGERKPLTPVTDLMDLSYPVRLYNVLHSGTNSLQLAKDIFYAALNGAFVEGNWNA